MDEALGLIPRIESTVGVRERTLWTAVELSYEKSEVFLDKFTGLAVSHGVIHRWAREEGERLLARDESQRTAVFMHRVPLPETAASWPLVYVQVERTGVHERGQPGSMKCKVGIVFSERAEISAGRVALLD